MSRKPPRSVKPFGLHQMEAAPVDNKEPESVLSLLIPNPLQGRMAWEWLRSMGADATLVALDWLLMGALLVPLRGLFPRIRTFNFEAGAPTALVGIALLHTALITLVAYTEGLHAVRGDLRKQARILGKAVLFATVVLCCAYVMQGSPWTVSVLLCAAGLLHFGTLWTWRWASQRRGGIASHCGDLRNVLIVGAGTVGQKVASDVARHRSHGRRVCGFLDDERPLGNGVIGRVADLALMARKGFVDEVILAAPRDRDLTQRVLREARRLRLDLEIVPELFGCKPAMHEIERVGDLPIICLHAERLPAAGLVVKRVIDVLGAGFALALLSPILAGIAILIKLDSAGPVLYCAPRAGRKGRLFRCYKFRSMVSEADNLKSSLRQKNERAGPTFKIASDPRITRLGRLLRRYSLDELPQLWNVVKGEMSLVGPRPHPLDDLAAYEIEHLARLDVTPGITGLWQVMARRDPSFQRGMQLDREYIRTWSLRLDIRILLRTLLAVVQGSGQ
jgi:exopolysaccharide biosynthesis polyprenyl glycosylphosphotransferase